MPESLNWLDYVIAFILIVSLMQGIRVGLINSAFKVIGIIAGITAAIMFYVKGSSLLLEYVALPQIIADVISFILIFSTVVITIIFLGYFFATITQIRLFKAADKIGGSVLGAVIGITVIGVILIFLTAFPLFSGLQDHVEESQLASPVMETTENIYDAVANFLPIDLPHLAVYPEELSNYFGSAALELENYSSHHNVDFEALDGSTCFVCEGPVEFLGFLNNEHGSRSPKFTCSDCGRTSDGCQTYEGYHEMYEQCPVELGKIGYRFDCGIWTNHSYHRPTGPCAYCGEE